MKTLSYSNVKYTLRITLILLTVEKIEHENFDFVLFLFPYAQLKNYMAYTNNMHTKRLLSEIFFVWVRAACKLRWASYGSKHTSRSLSDMPFCMYLHT